MSLEMRLRELARRLENIMNLIANGGTVDNQLVLKLDEISVRIDAQYRNSQTIDDVDIDTMNDLISIIELTIQQDNNNG